MYLKIAYPFHDNGMHHFKDVKGICHFKDDKNSVLTYVVTGF